MYLQTILCGVLQTAKVYNEHLVEILGDISKYRT